MRSFYVVSIKNRKELKGMGKMSKVFYKAGSESYKVARTINDIEDIASGNISKMIKRHIKRKIRKQGNKTLDNVFKKTGL